jgi:hypothetical protein
VAPLTEYQLTVTLLEDCADAETLDGVPGTLHAVVAYPYVEDIELSPALL